MTTISAPYAGNSCAVDDRSAPRWSLPDDINSEIERSLARESSSTSAGISLGEIALGRRLSHERSLVRQHQPTASFLEESHNHAVFARDSEVQRRKNQKALALLREWLADESGYDERTWPILKKAIEENRLSDRKRFSD